MKEVILIDGMNLAWKALHTYNLTTEDGQDVSVLFGFMSQLASILSKYKRKAIVVWDGGYPERTKLAEEGINKGLIKKAYKENRILKDEESAKKMDSQLGLIVEMIGYTDIKQVRVKGHEADDVIASYCEKIKDKYRVICFTSDHDYYQLIDDNVYVVSRLRGEEKVITKKDFYDCYNIWPSQWVEVGALCGDNSDCITGVPGCGEKNALKYIQEYNDVENLISVMSEKFSLMQKTYPDLSTEEDVKNLLEIEGEKVFEGCYVGMPFSGVALALANKKIKKVKKIELKFAMYQERVRLAYKLKSMKRDIDVPNISFKPTFSKQNFINMCGKYQMNYILDKMDNFIL